jgi:hypothetical protein
MDSSHDNEILRESNHKLAAMVKRLTSELKESRDLCRKLTADTDVLRVERDRMLSLLRIIEWEGYDPAEGERVCPVCEAWAYHKRHRYACALGLCLNTETEGE